MKNILTKSRKKRLHFIAECKGNCNLGVRQTFNSNYNGIPVSFLFHFTIYSCSRRLFRCIKGLSLFSFFNVVSGFFMPLPERSPRFQSLKNSDK